MRKNVIEFLDYLTLGSEYGKEALETLDYIKEIEEDLKTALDALEKMVNWHEDLLEKNRQLEGKLIKQCSPSDASGLCLTNVLALWASST